MNRRAMVLAAGKGTRLKPLTDILPKPLVPVGKEAVIVHTLRKLVTLGYREVVINAHHLAEVLMEALGDGSGYGLSILWSREETLLETGGGVRKALPLLAGAPFLAINGDIFWDMDLAPFLQAYDPERMTVLLGLVPNPPGGKGDFELLDNGKLRRSEGVGTYTYAGIQILDPRLFATYSVTPFSLVTVYDRAMQAGQLYGFPLSGFWTDIGTPDGLARARQYVEAAGIANSCPMG